MQELYISAILCGDRPTLAGTPGGSMRIARVLMTAGTALLVAVASAAILTAQAKTDEDYDALMKNVGAANGAMAKATDGAAVAAEAKKLQALFKDAQQFWTARNNKEAADWAAAAMGHAAEIEKAAAANNMEGVGAARKTLGGVCQTCHKANREKTETGFAIRKG
jgi:cytochrome c556